MGCFLRVCTSLRQPDVGQSRGPVRRVSTLDLPTGTILPGVGITWWLSQPRSGLQVLGPGARNAAFPTLTRFGRSGLQTDLHLSDRTLWPSLLLEWRHTSGRPVEHGLVSRTDVVKAHPARRSPYAKLIRHNCGAMTLAHSLEFVICRQPCYPAERGYMDLLERRGHWLIWFTYP